jgi:hypothetical protein
LDDKTVVVIPMEGWAVSENSISLVGDIEPKLTVRLFVFSCGKIFCVGPDKGQAEAA